MEILIIGAGPVGLAAALGLAQKGQKPRIIDKRASGSGLSRAVGIIPHTMRLLEPSGVADEIERQAIKIRAVHVFQNGRETLRLDLPQFAEKFEHFYGLPQDQTERIMREKLAGMGIEVEYSREFQALKDHGDRIEATVNGETQAYDYLIGADGIHSPVREALGIPYPGYEVDGEWSIIDGDAPDWAYQGETGVWLGEESGASIVIPIGDERYRLVGSGADPVARFGAPIEFQTIHRQGLFTISVRQAERYQKGRAFLAGDAAHCHSPVGGRGMNLGIDDAFELASRLVSGTLDGYSDARHKLGAKIIRDTERARKIMTEQHPFLRRSLLTILRHLPRSLKIQLVKNRLLRLG